MQLWYYVVLVTYLGLGRPTETKLACEHEIFSAARSAASYAWSGARRRYLWRHLDDGARLGAVLDLLLRDGHGR